MRLSFLDESMVGAVINQLDIETQAPVLSVREIIELRVRAEVDRFNQQREQSYFNGLIAPVDAEKTLNGYLLKPNQKIDAEKQYYIAVDAFQKNGFFMLINDKQVDDLNETFTLTPYTKISFVKITPLVGG
ncbi:hypothetical protein [Runella sp.]|uniref:hypothetical protein n=1 Tax=Runella sp. TaxID=1960881 RepID=UPI003D0DFFE5